MAIILGSGLALATTQKMNAHNVYWDGEDWQELELQPNQYTCPGSGWCTAYEDEEGNISDERQGKFTPLP